MYEYRPTSTRGAQGRDARSPRRIVLYSGVYVWVLSMDLAARHPFGAHDTTIQ